MVRRLQKIAMYCLPSGEMVPSADADVLGDASPSASEREFDMLVMTREIGESILVPAHGLTIQVGAIAGDRVTLQITVPSDTQVFRMGVVHEE